MAKLKEKITLKNKTGLYVFDDLEFYDVADNWREISKNIWQFDLGDLWWNPVYFVGFNNLHRHGPRVKTPSKWGEWQRMDGSATKSSRLEIYSEGIPGNIYFSTGQMACIDVIECNNLQINFNSIRHAGIGVRVTRSNKVTITGDINHVGIGMRITDSTDVSITNCAISNTCNAGIFTSGNSSNINIKDNSFSHCGWSESNGSIYFWKANGPGTVTGNFIHDQKYGKWWRWDGSGIYTDSGTTNIHVEHNRITDSYLALQDNSGSPGNVFTENTIVLCDYGMDITDSKHIGKANTRYDGNILINCKHQGGPRYTQESGNMMIHTE